MINVAFQEIIVKLKDNIDAAFGILDENFIAVACTEMARIGEDFSYMQGIKIDENPLIVNGKTYVKLDDAHLIFVDSDKKIAPKYANILAVTFSQTAEKPALTNKTEDFIKAILFDDILDSDINIKARELLIESQVSRVVLLFKINQIPSETSLKTACEGIFADNANNFVIEISQDEVAVIKEKDDAEKNLTEFANAVSDTLSAEFFIDATIGIGTVVNNLKEISTSFKKAQIALESGAENKAEMVRNAIRKVDCAVSKGILHKNTAARKKSQLARKLNKAG